MTDYKQIEKKFQFDLDVGIFKTKKIYGKEFLIFKGSSESLFKISNILKELGYKESEYNYYCGNEDILEIDRLDKKYSFHYSNNNVTIHTFYISKGLVNEIPDYVNNYYMKKPL